MTASIRITITLSPIDCSVCGITYGLDEDYIDRRRRDGKSFHCPNGHSQCFTETEAMRLAKKLKKVEEDVDWYRTRNGAVEDQLQATERSRRALKGVVTRQRNRTAAGVCPVDNCHRHFQNLQRHITSQHPGFKDADVCR